MEDGIEACKTGGGVIAKAQWSLSLSDHQNLLQNIVKQGSWTPLQINWRDSGGSPGICTVYKAPQVTHIGQVYEPLNLITTIFLVIDEVGLPQCCGTNFLQLGSDRLSFRHILSFKGKKITHTQNIDI